MTRVKLDSAAMRAVMETAGLHIQAGLDGATDVESLGAVLKENASTVGTQEGNPGPIGRAAAAGKVSDAHIRQSGKKIPICDYHFTE